MEIEVIDQTTGTRLLNGSTPLKGNEGYRAG